MPIPKIWLTLSTQDRVDEQLQCRLQLLIDRWRAKVDNWSYSRFFSKVLQCWWWWSSLNFEDVLGDRFILLCSPPKSRFHHRQSFSNVLMGKLGEKKNWWCIILYIVISCWQEHSTLGYCTPHCRRCEDQDEIFLPVDVDEQGLEIFGRLESLDCDLDSP